MRLLFLSNGHGEDLIGSRLALALRPLLPSAEITAFPVVGSGTAYEQAGFAVAGARRELPSGGLTLHSFHNLRRDLRAGLLGNSAGQLRDLRRFPADAVIVTGDLWALTLSLCVKVQPGRRFVLQPLVSLDDPVPLTGPNRLFMERITLPERLLQRRFTRRVWTRDAATAAELRRLGVSQAIFSGSFLEPVAPPAPGNAEAASRVLLLPGSRSWAEAALGLMLEAARLLPGVRFSVAWVAETLPAPDGWTVEEGREVLLRRDGVTVTLKRGAFRELLGASDAVLGTSGTALEEAAASGRPCLTFALPGRHSEAFLKNQARILKGALHVAPDSGAGTLSSLLLQLLRDPALRLAAARAGERLAADAGGTARIAEEIAALLS